MELGPRNGGNCIPEVIYNYTGVNMVALAVEASLGNTFPICCHINKHVLHIMLCIVVFLVFIKDTGY